MRTKKKTVEQKKTETARNPWNHSGWRGCLWKIRFLEKICL